MSEERTGVISGINGPVIYLKDAPEFRMGEMVYVGKERLVGEVIGLSRPLCRCMKRPPGCIPAAWSGARAMPSPSFSDPGF